VFASLAFDRSVNFTQLGNATIILELLNVKTPRKNPNITPMARRGRFSNGSQYNRLRMNFSSCDWY
jgi:hypothetical protein